MRQENGAENEREWQGQRDQDAHDAAVEVVKRAIPEPSAWDFGVAHRVVEAVLKIVDGREAARG